MAKKQNGKSEHRKDASASADAPRTFDLDDVDPDDAVIINGEPYRLTRGGQLSLIEQAAVARSYKRMRVISEKVERGEPPKATEMRDYRKCAEELVGIALPELDPNVINGMADDKLGRVIMLFIVRASTASGIARTISQLVPQTSADRSVDSSASTVATR